MRIYIYIYIYIHTYIHIYIYYIFMKDTHIYIYTCMCVGTRLGDKPIRPPGESSSEAGSDADGRESHESETEEEDVEAAR